MKFIDYKGFIISFDERNQKKFYKLKNFLTCDDADNDDLNERDKIINEINLYLDVENLSSTKKFSATNKNVDFIKNTTLDDSQEIETDNLENLRRELEKIQKNLLTKLKRLYTLDLFIIDDPNDPFLYFSIGDMILKKHHTDKSKLNPYKRWITVKSVECKSFYSSNKICNNSILKFIIDLLLHIQDILCIPFSLSYQLYVDKFEFFAKNERKKIQLECDINNILNEKTYEILNTIVGEILTYLSKIKTNDLFINFMIIFD